MRKRKAALWGAFVALALMSCGQPAPVHSAIPMTCEVRLNSQNGGGITVITIDKTPDFPIAIPLQISWSPASSDSSLNLNIKYQGSSFNGLDFPSGGFARFSVPSGAVGEGYEAIVTSKGGGEWRFVYPKDFSVGNGLADIILDGGNVNGRDVLSAVNNGEDISIRVESKGNIITLAQFETSEIAERDKLLSEARKLLETANAKVCRPI